MPNKFKYVLGLLLFLFWMQPIKGQEKLTRILFVFDASNSMNAYWHEGKRIDIAKEILKDAVDSLKGYANLELALRVYGHQSPVTPTFQDCEDTKLEVPFNGSNHDLIKVKIDNIQAKGTTPIARSLEAAADDFPDANSRNIIVLITDGLEACDRDPCIIAQKLKEKGIGVTPFVVGLGIDLQYLKAFECIGSYQNADTPNSLRNIVSGVVEQAITQTTVQINLNDINERPLESNVTMHIYKAGTNELKYDYKHTMNRLNNPDTINMNPDLKYDITVQTIPPIEKKGIALKKGIHNTIKIDAPQGYLDFNVRGKLRGPKIQSIVRKGGEMKTLNVQNINSKEKYIVGTYDMEILSLPRIEKKGIEITQSGTQTITIPAPGMVTFNSFVPNFAQIFVIIEGRREWVCNLNEDDLVEVLYLQPGIYEISYRAKSAVSTNNTNTKEFKVISEQSQTIKL